MEKGPSHNPEKAAERVSFGFREVAAGQKQDLVDAVFHRVARRYDLMNDLMSGGLHRLWKDALVDWMAPPRAGRKPYRVLDIAGGTGDVAFRIAGRSDAAEIVVADINTSMLAVGRDRALARRFADRVTFVEGNAEELPFESDNFDAVTIAFGLRNVTRIEKAIADAYRVLKRGGRYLILEFSAVDVAGLHRIYDLYSFNVIPAVGRVVVGDPEPYKYLIESIRRFPNQARLRAMLEDAGFDRVDYRNLAGGIVAIHSGWKL